MTTFLALLAVGTFAALVYRFLPSRSGRGVFHLDQFRPAAPLAGFLPTSREQDRLYADLVAIHAHQDQPEQLAA